MNRKFFTLLLFMLIAAVWTGNLKAQKNKAKPAAQEAALREEERLAAKRAALMEKAQQMLKGREWAIYVTVKPAAEKNPAVIETDSLIFTDLTVLSKNLSDQGYAKNGSNYSLSAGDKGIVVWETMQRHENGQDRAFLRGELNLNSGIMGGAIVHKLGKETATHYYSTVSPVEVASPPVISVPAAGEPEESKKAYKKEKK
ncbi:MAG: hypothetical protein A3J51_03100 [Omnitrophica WOR_2 bacterium RIFCSPHIGHO2_02_FULL_45_21]|nr:MAG: hypothetical protein A3J51_03100 [Omnitrophica WOR_2 bacterium RIFCSPHIGHO2_02_FULL_45_21]